MNEKELLLSLVSSSTVFHDEEIHKHVGVNVVKNALSYTSVTRKIPAGLINLYAVHCRNQVATRL